VGVCALVVIVFSLALSAAVSLAGVENDSAEAMASRPVRIGEGESFSVVLTPMPAKHQLQGGAVLDLFSASADSVLWCGPRRPNPHSWLRLSVICRSICDFDVVCFPGVGAAADTVRFERVEPAMYRVVVERSGGTGPWEYGLRFLYLGEVVCEFPKVVHER